LASEDLSPEAAQTLRQELQTLAREIHEHPRTAPAELTEDLLMLRNFYSETDPEERQAVERELIALRDHRLLPHCRTAPGAPPTSAQLEEALLAARISLELGDEVDAGLRELADDALNELHFGDVRDPEERIALAAFAVQVDRIFLSEDLSGLRSEESPEDAAEAARLLGERLLARIDLWQQELANAEDLPLAERFEQGRALAQALASYQILSTGDHPVLSSQDFRSRSEALENWMRSVFEEVFAAAPEAGAEDRELAREVAYDLRTRLHFALGTGDASWIAQLTPENLVAFAELSQAAHVLYGPLGEPPTAQEIEARLGAAAIFAQLGLDNRVRTCLEPIRRYANGIEDTTQRFNFLRNLAQIYQVAGMNCESDSVLSEIAALAERPDATEEIRQFAEVVPALQQINGGDLDRAAELLGELPENPLAQEALRGLPEGIRRQRLLQLTDVWSAVIDDYLEDYDGTRDPEVIGRHLRQALREAAGRVAAGEATSLYDALGASEDHDVRTFLYEGRHAYYASVLSDPEMGARDFAEGTLALARRFADDDRPALAMQLAQLVRENPHLGGRPQAFIDEIPGNARLNSLCSTRTLMLIPTPLTMVTGFLLTTDEEEAYTGLAEGFAGALTFGAATWAGAGGRALFVGTEFAGGLSPLARSTIAWGIRSGTEAAVFTTLGMGSQALFSGSTEGLTGGNFIRQLGSMLILSVLCHGIRVGTEALGTAAERVPWMAATEEAIAAGGPPLNLLGRSLVGATGYSATILGLTGTEYLNEALGLRTSEGDVPFLVRLFGSAVMDAQMRMSARLMNGLTGGALERLEQRTNLRMVELTARRSLLPTVERLGFDPRSPEGQVVLESLVARARRGERLADIDASMDRRLQGDIHRTLSMILDVAPNGERGRRLGALLLLYRQAHPEGRLAEQVGRIELEARRLSRAMGLRGAEAEAAQQAMLERFLAEALTPAQVHEAAPAILENFRRQETEARSEASEPPHYEVHFNDGTGAIRHGTLVRLAAGETPPAGRERWDIVSVEGNVVTAQNAERPNEPRRFQGLTGAGCPLTAGDSVYFLPAVAGGAPLVADGIVMDVFTHRVSTVQGEREVTIRLDPAISESRGGREGNLRNAFSAIQLDREYPLENGERLRFTGDILGQGSASTVFGAEIVDANGTVRRVAVKVRTHTGASREFINSRVAEEQTVERVLAEFDPAYADNGILELESGRRGLIMPLFVPENSVLFTNLNNITDPALRREIEPRLEELFAEMERRRLGMGDVEFVYDRATGRIHLVDIEGVSLNIPGLSGRHHFGLPER
jgi:hypothetical protein